MKKNRRVLALVATITLAAASFSGCGGGGGGGDNGGNSGAQPILLLITAAGVPAPLWQNVQGSPVTPPQCPAPVSLNAAITFTFAGPVDAASLPTGGSALGGINITTSVLTPPPGLTTPAAGSFTVSDDPSLPAGNRRRVNFLPTPPSDPQNPTTAGFAGAVQYTIFVPRGGGSGQVVTIGGQALQNDATTCFFTCDPQGAANCFTDPVSGPPFVTGTTPTTNDPSPAAILPSSVAANTVSILFNEPLDPSGVNINEVILRTPSGAQVPGSIRFFQAGTPQAGPIGARIDYIASSVLLSSTQYEIVLGPNIKDFGGNAAVLYDPASSPPASGRRYFQTVSVPNCPQPPIIETFDTTANRATVNVGALWTGNGFVNTIFPDAFVGNGSFGALTAPTGPSTLDPGQTTVTGLSQGVWNTTSITIPQGATVRCTGHTTQNRWRIHLRSTGTVSISGTLNANAGTSPTAAIGDTEQGPRAGQFNNGGTVPALQAVFGGVGGSGAGKGGDASQADATGTPVRTFQAQSGLGPPLANGTANPGPVGANPLYGGGGGGASNWLAPNPGSAVGDAGGHGGAGGSAFASGNNGGPNAAGAAPPCAPVNIVNPTIQRALATGTPPIFTPPVTVQSAGSGGGGGGDRFDITGATGDEQGGGGGGGGGGIRISARGDITLGASGSITCNGAAGAAGNQFNCGHGGGGSGGQIWLQTFGQLAIAATTNMQVNAGNVTTQCGAQAAGIGGIGLYQFEDNDAVVNTAFIGATPNGGNIVVAQFPFGTNVVGTAVSTFFDTGYGSPEFVSATETTNLGNAPGATIQITYQGAFENVTGGGPNLATLSAPVTGANITQLNGYRFIRFNITLSYTSPPISSPTNVLPSVDGIQIDFRAPVNCATP